MERRNREPQSALSLEEALWRIPEGHMVQFTTSGVRLFAYSETGESDLRTVRLGESEVVVRAPIEEPLLVKKATSLGEVIAADENPGETGDEDSYIADVITTPEYLAFTETLVSPEQVAEAAVLELKRRELEGDAETIPCSNCKGKASFQATCMCTQGGLTLLDLLEKGQDRVTALRKTGVADPDCDTCEGTGKRHSECSYCEGCGQAAKYPSIIIKNEVTGEQCTVKLDVAAMIARGEIAVAWSGQERVFSDGYEVGDRVLSFHVAHSIDAAIVALGIDKANAARVRGDTIEAIESEKATVSAGPRGFWKRYQGEITMHIDGSTAGLSAAEVLHKAQAALAQQFAWPYGKIKNSQGVAIAEEWVLRPLRPLSETLQDVKTAAAQYGYLLGCSEAFFATGETALAFYLTDDRGAIIAPLSQGLHIREALEDAWLTLQRLQKNIPEA